MKNIGQIVTEFNKLSRRDVKRIIKEKSDKVMEACINDTGNQELAAVEFGTLLYSVIAADDKVAGKEIKLLCTTAEAVLGDWVDPKKKKQLAEELLADKTAFEKGAKKLATEYLTKWADADKENLVFCCVAVCALDRKISNEELAWLDVLMNIANGNE